MPIGLAVEGANRHDMKLVRETIENIGVKRPEQTEEYPQNMCLDTGYDDQEVRDALLEFGFTAHIRSRGEEAKNRPRGWSASPTVGSRTHPQLAEPLPTHPGSLGEEGRELHCSSAFCLCPYRSAGSRVIRIGS